MTHRSRSSAELTKKRKSLTPARLADVALMGLCTAMLAAFVPSASAKRKLRPFHTPDERDDAASVSRSTAVECGTVRVPQYWTDPGTGTFTVHFRVYEHTDQQLPALEPIVDHGGRARTRLDRVGKRVQVHDRAASRAPRHDRHG